MCFNSSKNIFVGLILFLDCVFINGRSLPCNFIDSIDISGGNLQSNRSIFFNEIEFSEENYAEVNYILRNGTTSTIVKPYFRGCPCNIKTCIRLCCPFGSFAFNLTSNGEFTCSKNETAKNIKSQILYENNNRTEILNLPKHFSFIDRACKRHFFADFFQITNVKIKKTQQYFNQLFYLFNWIFCFLSEWKYFI